MSIAGHAVGGAGFSWPQRRLKRGPTAPGPEPVASNRMNRTLRHLPIGLLGLAAALVALQPLAGAQGIAGHDTNAPVQFAADQIELQDRQDRVVLSGDVVITQGDLTVKSTRATLAYTDNGGLQIHRLDATGGVNVARGNESASGAAAVYDFDKRIITMSGGVSLKRGTDTLHGGRLVIDLRTGLSSVDGRAGSQKAGQTGGRVTGTFTVPK